MVVAEEFERALGDDNVLYNLVIQQCKHFDISLHMSIVLICIILECKKSKLRLGSNYEFITYLSFTGAS